MESLRILVYLYNDNVHVYHDVPDIHAYSFPTTYYESPNYTMSMEEFIMCQEGFDSTHQILNIIYLLIGLALFGVAVLVIVLYLYFSETIFGNNKVRF